MVPARAMVCLSQKPSTENGKVCAAIVIVAWGRALLVQVEASMFTITMQVHVSDT